MKWACAGVSAKEKWRISRLQELLGDSHEMAVLDWQSGADIEKLAAGFQHLRWGEASQLEAAKAMTVQSAWTALLGVCDGMILQGGRWWPLCASYEAFCQTFTGLGSALDTDSSAFVAGAGSMARAAIAALFKSGFRKFRVTSQASELSAGLIHDMQLKFFGLDMQVVPMNKIVLLAGVSSVFVNTLSADDAPEVEQEIAYLNFLKRPGAVIDSTLFARQSVLMKEALGSGIPGVDGWQLAARIDALWAKWAFSKDIDVEAYAKILTERCGELDTSSSAPGAG